ncbi:hypothetical protein [Rheinheimera sp.]|uniref:hypothetical protein n=1 Tax=Rheinheimera sp. TaxID=1869214 RepID=UPI0040470AA9
MNTKIKWVIGALVVFQLVLSVQLAAESGKSKSLKDQQKVLLNLACSLEPADFKMTLDALSAPENFKKGLGDNADAAWELYKEQLFFTCFDEPAS